MRVKSYVHREEVDDFFGFKDRDFDGCLSFEEFMGEETTLGNKLNTVHCTVVVIVESKMQKVIKKLTDYRSSSAVICVTFFLNPVLFVPFAKKL